MDNVPNPAEIHDPWSLIAFVVVCALLAFMVWRFGRHAKRAADEIEHQSKPNSGSSLKDSLNRIEGTLAEVKGEQASQADRLAVLERAAEKRRAMWHR